MNKCSKIIFITVLVMLCISCRISVFFPQKRGYETYKSSPLERASVTPRQDGYYLYQTDETRGIILFKKDGSCIVTIVDLKFNELTTEEFVSRRLELISGKDIKQGVNSWAINNWGHYVIIDNKIKIQYRSRYYTAQEYKLITLNGHFVGDEEILIAQRSWAWTYSRSKAADTGSDEPNMRFEFIEREINLPETGLKEKRWYRKNVWYNNQ